MYSQHLAGHTYSFASLTEVMAKASPIRSGDQLAGCAAHSAAERVAAAMVLADVELREFIRRPLIEDAVTDLIHRTHDSDAFRPLAHMTVGAFREYLLEQAYRSADISSLAWGLTPEMAAAVSKLMSNGELIAVSAALSVVTKFRTTLGLPGRLSSRLQPNHPTDDPAGVAASVLDGLLFGCGDGTPSLCSRACSHISRRPLTSWRPAHPWICRFSQLRERKERCGPSACRSVCWPKQSRPRTNCAEEPSARMLCILRPVRDRACRRGQT
ncbi:putative ethanolamine ammonia-lyase, large subunit [Corynebacterium kroppenstedtii]|nr:putative ethanolamine ammonia-lyase, large subunit [Corynebacterium kroppenstedtii]